MSFTYEYPRPAVTVDIILFSKEINDTHVLLIQRKYEPFKDEWALPGGFVEMDETLEESAMRELAEETGIKEITIHQFYTFGDPGRDPRGRTVSIIFYAFANRHSTHAKAGDDAKHLEWHSISELPPLAFDHQKALYLAIEKLL